MSLINDKQEIFGQIAALKTLNDGFPSFLLSNSVPSINNKQDALNFLVDLLKSLVGYEKLKDSIIDLLTYELDNIEIEVKKTLKLNIKKYINCNSNPKIPDFLKHEKVIPSSTGINLEVKKIDLIDLMHIEPTSEVGHMFYDDASSGLKSTDFNTFLYNLIQDGNQQDWGNNSVNPILSFKFLQNGTINNIVNVKASEYYSTTINNKSINDLNSDYIDSIKLFASDKVISNIIDSLFGTISSLIKKDIKTLTKEEEINSIIDKLINANDDQLIDDSYFEFSDLEIYNHQETASNRKNGIRKLITCNEIESTILLETLSGITTNIVNSQNVINKKEIISNGFNTMADELASNAGDTDKQNVKLNFIDLLINKIIKAIINIVLSPKMIILFALNYKITIGNLSDYLSIKDFIQKNRQLFKPIIDTVKDIIIAYLLKLVLKEITILMASETIKNLTERANNKKAQILSLLGASQEKIKEIINSTKENINGIKEKSTSTIKSINNKL